MLFVLIIIIIIVSGVGGYIIGAHKLPILGTPLLSASPSPIITITSQPPSPTTNASASATISPSQGQASVTAVAFYTWYVDCVNHHFQIKSQKSVAEDCIYQTNTNVSTQLASNVANHTGLNPILCSLNIPDSVTVARVTSPSTDTAATTMVETFGKVQKRVVVTLAHEKSTWKIINITCPSV